MLELLSDEAQWRAFYQAKAEGGHMRAVELRDLERFIDGGEYLAVARAIQAGEPLPLPVAREINKKRSAKKRMVFTYPRAYNYALKLIAWLLRRYDGVFSPNLHSFRQGMNVRRALRRLLSTPNLREHWVYKADVHDYFNSVDVELLLPKLRRVLADDPPLYEMLEGMLRCPQALRFGRPVTLRKGIMAGTPVSPFLANVCLMGLDARFEALGAPYARYSDDIIVFAPNEEALGQRVDIIHEELARQGLSINPDKEAWSRPHEAWTFLGFTYRDGALDVAPASVQKLKGKLRRKARALVRWRRRKGKDGGQAARAFIRHFNRRLYDNPRRDELTWALWYFPVINTDESLRALDHYMQDCLRYIVAGNHGKKRFNLRYATLREWGYRPLVHEYYLWRAAKDKPAPEAPES